MVQPIIKPSYTTNVYSTNAYYFAALMLGNQEISFIAKKGPKLNREGFFIAGMYLPEGVITEHMPDHMLKLFEKTKIMRLEHTNVITDCSIERIKLLRDWCEHYGEDIS